MILPSHPGYDEGDGREAHAVVAPERGVRDTTGCIADADLIREGVGKLRVTNRANALSAPPQVLGAGNRLQMRGVDTGALDAEVVYLEAERNRAYELDVRDDVRLARSTRVAWPVASADLAVAIIADSVLPDPAGGAEASILEAVIGWLDRAQRTAMVREIRLRFSFDPASIATVAGRKVGKFAAAALAVAVWNRVFGHAASYAEVVFGGRGSSGPRPLHSIRGWA